MDYEKKYLKYKSKYNLKKSSLVRGGGEKIMKGGNIDRIADLVFSNVPMIREDSTHRGFNENTIQVNKVKKFEPSQITWTLVDLPHATENNVYISDEWKQYIQFSVSDIPPQRFTIIKLLFKDMTIPNTFNRQGQTLLYLAAQNCNKQMFDTLVAMGADPMVLNHDGSSILHGIAWGKVDASDIHP